MSYSKSYTTWKDFPDTSTPMTAAKMQNMDDGISTADTTASAAIAKSVGTTAGDIIYFTGASTPVRLALGAAGTVLKGGVSAPSWATIVNADVDAAAAIAYSKLNLATSIVNADVAAAAAIQPSKLASYPSNVAKGLAGDGTWPDRAFATAKAVIAAQSQYTANVTAVANQAVLIPLDGPLITVSVTRIVYNIVTQSGNMDLGIYYSDDQSTFTRLFSTGSFATPAAGTNIKTVASQTLTVVDGRRWYLGVAFDNAVAVFIGQPSGAGVGFSKTASFALPASLSGMTSSAQGAVMSVLT